MLHVGCLVKVNYKINLKLAGGGPDYQKLENIQNEEKILHDVYCASYLSICMKKSFQINIQT